MELEGWEDRGRSRAGFSEKIETKILLNGNVSSSRLWWQNWSSWSHSIRLILLPKNYTQFNENHTVPLTCCSLWICLLPWWSFTEQKDLICVDCYHSKFEGCPLPQLMSNHVKINAHLHQKYMCGNFVRSKFRLQSNCCTGREWLIRSHSSARFCFELSGNSN